VSWPVGLLYRGAYRLGLKPWDTGEVPPELVALVEGPNALRPGRALDLGCGTGTHVVYLERRGWQTTGVDLVGRALSAARRRAVAAGVEPTLIEGDVTRLTQLGIGDGYDLIFDFGCYHSLYPMAMRDAYARNVTAVAAQQATLLLYGLVPNLPSVRMTKEEVQVRFPEWQLVNHTHGRNRLATEAFQLHRRATR
jgi:SAM-dependent methyltransferase